jgi:Fe-S cluster biogenesis protein NfuA
MIQEQAVESALAALRPGLASDGFDLRIGGVSSDSVVLVILEAKPGACLDCLVPDEYIVSMIEDLIRKEGADLNHVVLAKEGFAAAGSC